MTTPTTGLHLYSGQRTVHLATYERDGRPVGSSAVMVVDGDRAYIRAARRSREAERLRNRPEAEITPATLGGTPAGAPLKAGVRRLEGREARLAAWKLARRHPFVHGLAVPLAHRLRCDRTNHYELRLIGE